MSDCVVWTRAINNAGYGIVSKNGRKGRPAHRVAWEEKHGPIPDGLVIDHLCRNRACVNPEHMRIVTQAENVRAARTTKLTVDMVREIRRRFRAGETRKNLAQDFGVSYHTIVDIVLGRRWKEVL